MRYLKKTNNTTCECILNTVEQSKNNYEQLLDEKISEYEQKKMNLNVC